MHGFVKTLPFWIALFVVAGAYVANRTGSSRRKGGEGNAPLDPEMLREGSPGETSSAPKRGAE